MWPVVEELLQCVYGDLARCAFALCGNMLEPSVDVVLVGCAIANGGHHVEDRVVLGADSIDLFHLREESPEGIARTSTLVEAFRTRHNAKFSSTREVMVPECTEPRTDAFAYKVFRQLPASRQHDATAQSYSSVVLGGTFDHLHVSYCVHYCY